VFFDGVPVGEIFKLPERVTVPIMLTTEAVSIREVGTLLTFTFKVPLLKAVIVCMFLTEHI
jgi:hypothetical protein